MTGKHPLFSILIPVHNVEKYLEQCIESVLNQSWMDYEIIIIDDGSTDNSGAICDRYAEKHASIHVHHQENKGLMMTRKQGLLRATGEYCLFLDSDDYYEPTLLAKAAECIQQDEPDLLIFNKYVTYKNKICSNSFGEMQYEVISKEEGLLRFMSSDQYTSIFTKVIRRELILPFLDEIYVPVSYAEDALQTAHFILLSSKIAILNQCLYYYRIRNSSLIHQKTPEKLLEILQVKEKIYELIKEKGFLTKENEKSYFGNTLNDLMDGLFRVNNRNVSMKVKKRILQDLCNGDFAKQILIGYGEERIAQRNKIRVKLLKNSSYEILIILDRMLMIVQRMADFINHKERFA